MIGCLVCSAYVSALAVGAIPLIAYDSMRENLIRVNLLEDVALS